MSNQGNEEDENLTVSKLFETFQTSEFLNNLYWDVLSDIKEKPSFKQLREIVEKIIMKNIDAIEKLPDSGSDVARKSIIAEVCSVTYAIDALFSKVLYMKLEKVYQGEILNIMKELKNEGKLPEELSSKIQIFSNSSSSSESNKAKETIQSKETQEVDGEKIKQNDISCGEGSSTLKNQENISENRVSYRAGRKSSKKDIEDSIKASKAITKKTAKAPNPPQKKSVDSNTSLSSKNTEVILKPENEDSDAESEISVGHLSIASVSSVHTSDLSSFDDEISISSEDEEGSKKRLSLKYLQQICENGTPKLDKISNGNKPKKLQKEIKENLVIENNVDEKKEIQKTPKKTKEKTEIQVSPVKTTPNTPESTSSELSTSMISKRVRKPNSKYASNNIVCHSVKVKERKKQDGVSSKNTNEKNSSCENSPMKKRSRSESSDVEIPNKMLKLDANEEDKKVSNEKSALKQTKNSDLIKPQSSVRSLTSRKTAPVTLYSTS